MNKRQANYYKISSQPFSFLKKKKISPTEKVNFLQQLATLLNAGISLLEALSILQRENSHLNFQHLFSALNQCLQNGLTFSESLKQHPNFLDSVTCHLLSAGEKVGKLEKMLEKSAYYQEKILSIKQRIKKALFYPCTILFVSLFTLIILFYNVIPQFELLFSNFNTELPYITRLMITISHGLKTYRFFVLLGFFALIILYKYPLRSRLGNKRLRKALLNVPFIGALMINSLLARFFYGLSTLMTAGIPLAEALDEAAKISNDEYFIAAIHRIRTRVVEGQLVSQSMDDNPYFSHQTIRLISIGEQTGELDTILEKLAVFYEREFDKKIDYLDILLEPLIMLLLGLIIGGLVVALYVPLFKLSLME